MSKKKESRAASIDSVDFTIPRFSWVLGGLGFLFIILGFVLQHVVSFATGGSKTVLFFYQSVSNAFSWFFVILEAGAVYYVLLKSYNRKGNKVYKIVSNKNIEAKVLNVEKQVFNPLALIGEDKVEESTSAVEEEMKQEETTLEEVAKISEEPALDASGGIDAVAETNSEIEINHNDKVLTNLEEENGIHSVEASSKTESSKGLTLVDVELPFDDIQEESSGKSEVAVHKFSQNNDYKPIPSYIDPTNETDRFLS